MRFFGSKAMAGGTLVLGNQSTKFRCPFHIYGCEGYLSRVPSEGSVYVNAPNGVPPPKDPIDGYDVYATDCRIPYNIATAQAICPVCMTNFLGSLKGISNLNKSERGSLTEAKNWCRTHPKLLNKRGRKLLYDST